MQTVSISHAEDMPNEDADYASLLSATARAISAESGPLFTTAALGLAEAFLGALPAGRRQHYECRACRRFLDDFGGLATIDSESGEAHSVFWPSVAMAEGARGFFGPSVRAIAKTVARAPVTGAFISSAPAWGLPSNRSPKSPTGAWWHLHAMPDPSHVFKGGPLKTADQRAAEVREEYGMLYRGLAEYPAPLVEKAHVLLTTGVLYRSEKHIGVAAWLRDIHMKIGATKHARQRENLAWLAAATAPPGFCHVRSTMIGTLLEDLKAGRDVEEIKRAFNAKMDPGQYQRPQAAPTTGQLAAAEKVVAALASSGALARRYARLEEALPYAIWKPQAPAQREERTVGRVFAHLAKPKAEEAALEVRGDAITWAKFQRTVLPSAERIELLVPSSLAPFFAFCTAVDPSAPTVLQWDREVVRNTVSWYFARGGSSAQRWSLTPLTHVDVDAITPQPSSWTGPSPHHGEGAFFILRGARDTHQKSGLGLFPEILRSEYHGIRSAIEAFSNAGELAGADEASACGIAIQQGSSGWGLVVRVTLKGNARVTHRIDRWD